MPRELGSERSSLQVAGIFHRPISYAIISNCVRVGRLFRSRSAGSLGRSAGRGRLLALFDRRADKSWANEADRGYESACLLGRSDGRTTDKHDDQSLLDRTAVAAPELHVSSSFLFPLPSFPTFALHYRPCRGGGSMQESLPMIVSDRRGYGFGIVQVSSLEMHS